MTNKKQQRKLSHKPKVSSSKKSNRNSNAKYSVQIDLTRPETHRVQITIKRLNTDWPTLLRFPVWTPGSYMVREYSQHVSRLSGAKKVSKNTWRPEADAQSISYEVYGFERTVRTNYIDANTAVLIGAALLPLLNSEFSITLCLPKSWNVIDSALGFKGSMTNGEWTAQVQNDDHWIDSPIVAAKKGFGSTKTFKVGTIPHSFTWVGIEPSIDMKKLLADTKLICEQTIKMFGSAPFTKYHYLIDFAPGTYGGLEHRESQLDQFDPDSLVDPAKYDAFLGLLAHEYFHAWNVKSVRPESLGPFNYLEENYTEDLWFAEGITSYFDEKIPLDCGLISEDAFWRSRLKDVNFLKDGNPGHIRRSLRESSFDAWICLYHRNEDWLNRDVNYYIKGAQLAWCWDARLQKHTKKKWSLARLMRRIYENFGITSYENLDLAKPGYTRDQLIDFCTKVTGLDHVFVHQWVSAHAPLPWREAAEYFKLKLKENVVSCTEHLAGFMPSDDPSKLTAGVVFSGSAAESGGLAPKDEILAVNNVRVTNKTSLETILKNMKPGKTAWLISRNARVYELTIQLKKHPGLGVEQTLMSGAQAK